MIRLFLPVASIWPLPLEGMLPEIRKYFEGVEVLLKSDTDEGFVNEMRQAVERDGLSLHFHELWSYENNPGHWFNKVAAVLGKIPWETKGLSSQLPAQLREPVVCYPWHHAGIPESRRDKLWLQTAAVYDKEITYREFLHVVRDGRFGVVFDTQHVLELRLGEWGVGALEKYSSAKLQNALLRSWDELGPYTKEIHFNNFVTHRGHTGSRNCLPNEGVLDLRAFAKQVVRDGWSGVVTPEVTPGDLFPVKVPGTPFPVPIGKPRLRMLQEMVREMFS